MSAVTTVSDAVVTRVLDGVRRGVRARRVARDVAIGVSGAVLAGFALAAIDSRFLVPAAFRALALGLGLAVAARLVLARARGAWRLPSRGAAAMRLAPGSLLDQDLLVSGAEFSAPGSNGDESSALRAVVRAEADRRAATFDLRSAARVPFAAAGVFAGLAATASLALAVALSPASARVFASRALLLSEARYPLRTEVAVDVPAGGLRVVAGDDLEVVLLARGDAIAAAALLVRAPGSGDFERVPALSEGGGRFTARLRSVTAPLEVAAIGGDDRDGAPLVPVAVLHPPAVRAIEAEIRLPEYARRAEDAEIQRGGDVRALAGSRVTLRVTPLPAAAAGEIAFSDGRRLALAPDAGGALAASFDVERSIGYTVELRDSRGLASRAAPPYRIDAEPDRPPECALEPLGHGGDATPGARLSVRGRARDDHGLMAARLRAGSGRTIDLALEPRTREARLDTVLEIGPAKPGDRLSVVLEAEDALPGGAQRALSEPVSLRVVTAETLFRRLLDEIRNVRRRLGRDLGPAETVARLASELRGIARALDENRVGGKAMSEAVASAALCLESGDVLAARRALDLVADAGEIAALARGLADDQAAAAERIEALRDEALRGRAPGEKGRALEAEERAIERRVASLRESASNEVARGGAAPALVRAAERLETRAAEAAVLDAIARLERSDPVGGALAALAAAAELGALAAALEAGVDPEILAAREGATPAGPPPPVDDALRRLLEEVERRAEDDAAAAAAARDPEALRRELEDLAKLLEEAKLLVPEALPKEEPPSPEEAAAARATEAAGRSGEIESAESRVGRLSLREKVELRRESFEATRDALRRQLDAALAKREGALERDASRAARGQNQSGEVADEKLKPGSDAGLFPDATPGRAVNASRPWGERPPRTAADVLRANAGALLPGFEDALAIYYRTLATDSKRDRAR